MIEDYDYEGAVLGLLSAHHSLPKTIIVRGVYEAHPLPRKSRDVIVKRIGRAIESLASRKDVCIEKSMVRLNTCPIAPIDYKYARYWKAIRDQGPVSKATLRAIGTDISNAELDVMRGWGVIVAKQATTPLGKSVVRYEAVS